ncbi:unnamed protein product [Didymodactylos carnosus]|uniref:Uncharacterized protein n=1 Tax=Didymodactylos carnosus TaxID=1234261 RepID=A0A816AFQ3_9BILA|nr:unnamed protein product [Didymodactylos carnosus]CAF4471120.1 unnamed protein product [Didymodactylos carnosus]
MFQLNQKKQNRINECTFDHIDVCQTIENRTLLFVMNGLNGYASEFNNLVTAFAYSIATRRRFLLDVRNWNYGNFNDYFNMRSMNLTLFTNNSKRKIMTGNENENHHLHLEITRQPTGLFSQLWQAARRV